MNDLMMKIYLDWNVITTLRQIENLTNSDDIVVFRTLLNVIDSLGNMVVVPYSDGHLEDLMKSYKKGERERVNQSLEFLSLLTQDVCLAQSWDEEFVRWHHRNPEEHFASLIEEENEITFESILESQKELGYGNLFDMFKHIPHNIDFEQVELHSPFFSSFFERAKVDNSLYAVIEDFIRLVKELRTNPVVYNELRAIFKLYVPLDGNIHNSNNVIEMLDAMMPKTMLNKSFTELYQEGMETEISKNKDYSKIITMFMQLDYVGYASDKLTDKNQYSNLFNDARHCFYASQCQFFITSDKKTYKKAKAVYESENIPTKVMKPAEFIEYFKSIEDESISLV